MINFTLTLVSIHLCVYLCRVAPKVVEVEEAVVNQEENNVELISISPTQVKNVVVIDTRSSLKERFFSGN